MLPESFGEKKYILSVIPQRLPKAPCIPANLNDLLHSDALSTVKLGHLGG